MPTMLVTCPESAHLEEITFEAHPLGVLIRKCSALRGCNECPRTCAARLDRRFSGKLVGATLLARSCLKR
jgi:hypothetical protein